MALVAIEAPRAWIRPGARGLVDYNGDRFSHERLFLYPFDTRTWLVETADDDRYLESLNAYSRMRKRTGAGAGDLAEDVRNAVVYENAIPKETLLNKNR